MEEVYPQFRKIALRHGSLDEVVAFLENSMNRFLQVNPIRRKKKVIPTRLEITRQSHVIFTLVDQQNESTLMRAEIKSSISKQVTVTWEWEQPTDALVGGTIYFLCKECQTPLPKDMVGERKGNILLYVPSFNGPPSVAVSVITAYLRKIGHKFDTYDPYPAEIIPGHQPAATNERASLKVFLHQAEGPCYIVTIMIKPDGTSELTFISSPWIWGKGRVVPDIPDDIDQSAVNMLLIYLREKGWVTEEISKDDAPILKDSELAREYQDIEFTFLGTGREFRDIVSVFCGKKENTLLEIKPASVAYVIGNYSLHLVFLPDVREYGNVITRITFFANKELRAIGHRSEKRIEAIDFKLGATVNGKTRINCHYATVFKQEFQEIATEIGDQIEGTTSYQSQNIWSEHQAQKRTKDEVDLTFSTNTKAKPGRRRHACNVWAKAQFEQGKVPGDITEEYAKKYNKAKPGNVTPPQKELHRIYREWREAKNKNS